MRARRHSRELAMQFLFQGEFHSLENLKKEFETFKNSFEIDLRAIEYAEKIVNGVLLHKADIDSLIEKHSINWKLNRITHIDRNILRVAIFEIHFSKDPVPPKTIINEAIEIAKKFGNVESNKFINGVLDQVAKSK